MQFNINDYIESRIQELTSVEDNLMYDVGKSIELSITIHRKDELRLLLEEMNK